MKIIKIKDIFLEGFLCRFSKNVLQYIEGFGRNPKFTPSEAKGNHLIQYFHYFHQKINHLM